MRRRRLGTQGPLVSTIGLGCLGLTSAYGTPDRREALATLHRAMELGVTLFDTSDAYGAGQNESFVGEGIGRRRDGLVIATKFGNVRGLNGELGGTNGRPDYVPVACDASLRRLGVEWIDLYYQHRVDPDVPIEETVGAMAVLVEKGKVRYLGLCEAGAETIRRAHSVHSITALQMEYSLWSRDAEAAILPITRELGIGFVAYSPLGRGFLTGALRSRDSLGDSDLRQIHPRFQAGNFERNLKLLDAIDRRARAKGCTLGQIALAWVLARGTDIVPIPGTARRVHLEENLWAANLDLADEELNMLDAVFPPHAASGPRYPEHLLEKLCI
jgi:aryl-alcohol dehydrogenase-like predicted oxidoreductase